MVELVFKMQLKTDNSMSSLTHLILSLVVLHLVQVELERQSVLYLEYSELSKLIVTRSD